MTAMTARTARESGIAGVPREKQSHARSNSDGMPAETAEDGRRRRPITVVARATVSGTSDRILSVLPTAKTTNSAVSENSTPGDGDGNSRPQQGADQRSDYPVQLVDERDEDVQPGSYGGVRFVDRCQKGEGLVRDGEDQIWLSPPCARELREKRQTVEGVAQVEQARS